MKAGSRPFLAPGADDARRLLEEELAEPAYVEAQPNIFERILAEFFRGIARLLDGVGGLGPGPGTLVVAIGAALLIVVAVLLIRPRLNARGRKQEAAVFDDDATRSGTYHRERAAALAGERNWNGAVAELLRAIIRSAEERVMIGEQPGRTATEAAGQLGRVLPSLSRDVAWLADLFNETHYGSGTATAEDYRCAAGIDAGFSDAGFSTGRTARTAGSTTPVAPR